MSASHNPAGIKEDWGIKFNYNSGEPAPERITDAIYTFTQNIDSLKQADIPDTDLAAIGLSTYGDFEVTPPSQIYNKSSPGLGAHLVRWREWETWIISSVMNLLLIQLRYSK